MVLLDLSRLSVQEYHECSSDKPADHYLCLRTGASASELDESHAPAWNNLVTPRLHNDRERSARDGLAGTMARKQAAFPKATAALVRWSRATVPVVLFFRTDAGHTRSSLAFSFLFCYLPSETYITHFGGVSQRCRPGHSRPVSLLRCRLEAAILVMAISTLPAQVGVRAPLSTVQSGSRPGGGGLRPA